MKTQFHPWPHLFDALVDHRLSYLIAAQCLQAPTGHWKRYCLLPQQFDHVTSVACDAHYLPLGIKFNNADREGMHQVRDRIRRGIVEAVLGDYSVGLLAARGAN